MKTMSRETFYSDCETCKPSEITTQCIASIDNCYFFNVDSIEHYFNKIHLKENGFLHTKWMRKPASTPASFWKFLINKGSEHSVVMKFTRSEYFFSLLLPIVTLQVPCSVGHTLSIWSIWHIECPRAVIWDTSSFFWEGYSKHQLESWWGEIESLPRGVYNLLLSFGLGRETSKYRVIATL